MKLFNCLCISLAILCFFLRIFFLYRFEIYGSLPDLLLIILVYVAIHGKPKDVAMQSFILGLICDLNNLESLGIYIFAYLICGMTVIKIQENISCEFMIIKMIVVFIISFFVNTLYFFMICIDENLSPEHLGVDTTVFFSLICTALYTFLVSPIIFILLEIFYFYSNQYEKSLKRRRPL